MWRLKDIAYCDTCEKPIEESVRISVGTGNDEKTYHLDCWNENESVRHVGMTVEKQNQ